MAFIISLGVADSGAQVQRLERTSPIRDIHTAQVESLMKDKEGIGISETAMRYA